MVEPGTLLVRMRESVRADEHARMHASVFVIRAHLFEARWYSRIRMRAQIECVLLLFFQASSTLECVFLQACLYLLTYLNPFPCLPPIHHSPHPPVLLARPTPPTTSVVFFDYDAEVCRQRVAARTDHPKIPFGGGAKAVAAHSKTLSAPLAEEGFGCVHVVQSSVEAEEVARRFGGL